MRPRKNYLCKICQESNPSNFYVADKSTCKKCRKEQSVNHRLEAKLNPPMIGERRTCVRCNTEKDASHDFYESNQRTCKTCVSKRSRTWCTTNYTRFLWLQAKTRAKRDSREFSIKENDIQIPKFCPVFGIELSVGGPQHQRDNSPSIDRIDSTKGYTPDNVRVISYRANTIKNNATIEELEAIILYMKQSSK